MTTKTRQPARRTSIQRPLGGTEKIYWLLDKLYCLNFAAYVELQGDLDSAQLQTALDSVQEETPLLRCRIAVDGNRLAFAPVDPLEHPLLLSIEGLRGWRRQLEQQLDHRFADGSAPLARVLWFRGKTARSVLAVVFHHPIADGRSGLHVLQRIVQCAAGTAPPFAYRPAHASAQELDLIKEQNPVAGKLKELKFWLARGRELLKKAEQLPGYDADPSTRRQTRSIELIVGKSLSRALLDACRAHDTSIHGALGAAQVLALNDEFGARKSRVMALNSLADLRPVIAGALSEQDLGLYVSTLTTVHDLAARPDFWQLAGEVRDELQRIIGSGDANLIHSFYPESSLFPPDERGARMVQRIVALAPPSSMLTNIGRIGDIDLGPDLAVRKTGFLLSPPAQNPICVTASSYQGRMILNLLHDRSKIGEEQAKRIAAHLLGHLEQAATGE